MKRKKGSHGTEKDRLERIQWVDAAKGIGILLVVLGHAPRDVMRSQYAFIDFLYFFIYTFHMHFFFFLSGFVYGYRNSGNKKADSYIIGKIRSLLVPWGIFSLLIYGIVFIINQVPAIERLLAGTFLERMPFGDYLHKALLGYNPYCIHVWYMYILFIVQIIVFLLQKLLLKCTGDRAGSLRMWAGLEIAAVLAFLLIPAPVLAGEAIKEYLLYYVFGIICSKLLKNGKRLYFAPWMFLGIVICIVNVLVLDMGSCEKESVKYLIYLLRVFVGTPFMVLLLVSLAQRISKQGKGIQWLGRNSFTIYLLHQPFCCAVLGTVMVMVIPVSVISCLAIMAACIVMSILFPMSIRFVSYKLGMGKLFEILTGGRP